MGGSIGRKGARRSGPVWVRYSDEELLDLRFCDLGLTIAGSMLEERIAQLQRELERRDLDFQPHFWLSEEWFTPDGVPGIAIAFYLAHPRLMRLERNQMLDVEGGSAEWCMKILRHEAGHAIDNAYRLRRFRARQRLFGRSSTRYPTHYSPQPRSRRHVLHLNYWYAQSHPDEDFAETFAVWLKPRSMWRRHYAGWPALRKLAYMDELMRSIAGQPPLVRRRRRVEPLSEIRKTLREHYRQKRRHHGVDHPEIYDRDLARIFSNDPADARNMTAAQFLARIRREVRHTVARGTGVSEYAVDQVLSGMIERCRALKLRLGRPPEVLRDDFTVLLTVQTMHYLHSGRQRVAL